MPDITVIDCPICARGYPLDVLAEFPTTWVTGGIEAPLPGYACVVAKRHVTEPFELGEAEVARLVAAGLSNKEIGARLLVSETTVATHIRAIMNKLGFNSRAQIAGWMASSNR